MEIQKFHFCSIQELQNNKMELSGVEFFQALAEEKHPRRIPNLNRRNQPRRRKTLNFEQAYVKMARKGVNPQRRIDVLNRLKQKILQRKLRQEAEREALATTSAAEDRTSA